MGPGRIWGELGIIIAPRGTPGGQAGGISGAQSSPRLNQPPTLRQTWHPVKLVITKASTVSQIAFFIAPSSRSNFPRVAGVDRNGSQLYPATSDVQTQQSRFHHIPPRA
jgi:hypothetical protein